MTATRVHFTSYVDTKGYKIVPARRPHRQAGQSEADWVLNSTSRDWAEARIVGEGGAAKAVRLSNYPLLYKEFTNVKTPEELLKFITEYGPLTYARIGRGRGDQIPPLLDEAASMKECFKSRGRSLPAWTMANLSASLSVDKTKGTVSVKISPVRLLDALWLQLGQALAEGTKWRECEHCHEWFPVGGNSGKRLVSKFCTEEHRIKFNSLERSR